MQRNFVYRTVPQLRFHFIRNPKTKTNNPRKFTLSQKFLNTDNSLPEQKVIFKTKNNILQKDYRSKEQQLMNCKSVLIPPTRAKPRQTHRNHVLNETKGKKFHELTVNDVSWEKWKSPFSIVRNNKENYARNSNKILKNSRYRSMKRCITQAHQRTSDQRSRDITAKQAKINGISRQLAGLKRMKGYIEDKKVVINLMKRIQEYQQIRMDKTFRSYRGQIQEVVEYYNKQKFDPDYIKDRMKTSVY